MDGSLTVGQLMNVAVWGLGLGTAFFSLFGIRAEKDVFLLTGLLACLLGNIALCLFLLDQDGANNDTLVTLFAWCVFQLSSSPPTPLV
jgi:hypothetical protein